MTRSRLSRAGLAMPAALVALAVGACGSSTSNKTAPHASGSATTASGSTNSAPTSGKAPTNGKPKPTGTPIKIGVIYGVAQSFGNTLKAAPLVAKAWAKWVNADMGGVNGHPVRIIAMSDQGTPDGGLAAARQLVADKVAGIDVMSQITEGAIESYLPKTGVPLIGGQASVNDEIGLNAKEAWPNTWFAYDQPTQAEIVGSMVAAKASGNKSMIAAFCSEVAACAASGSILKSFAPKIPIDYKGVFTVGAGQASYTAQCLTLKSSGATSVDAAFDAQALQPFVTQCNAQGFTGTYVLSATNIDPSIDKSLKGDLVGTMQAFPWWVDAPPVNAYRAVMAKFAPGVNYAWVSASNTWTALELFRDTMTKHGPAASAAVTPAVVIKAYHQVKNETLDGLLSQPITFHATGPQPEVKCQWIFKYDPSSSNPNSVFTEVPNPGKSGNGLKGPLSTWCSPV